MKLAPLPVTVLSPAPLGEGASSAWAQGGIAAAVGEGDSPAVHAADTIKAGCGLVDPDVARTIAEEASARVRDLLAYGVPFDRDLAGHFLLSREAAHSANRVVRVAGDLAGAAIMQALIAVVRATPSITVIEGCRLLDLVVAGRRITGVRLALSNSPSSISEISPIAAMVLATGGVGGLYARTTNPPHALGEGLAIAARAGAAITDAEFVQFHPTAIDCALFPTPLASEALRGEGATLIDKRGQRFMFAVHPDGELAPRDIVARAVHRQLRTGEGAFLDCRQAIGSKFQSEFPTVFAKCREAGIDPVSEPIPVTPAAHYHMGGVATDLFGRTTVAGLWAVGEVARTGLHGANRLASNSLLEAVVLGARAARNIATWVGGSDPLGPAEHRGVNVALRASSESETTAVLTRLRATMLEHVGVERDAAGLAAAIAEIAAIERAVPENMTLNNVLAAARFIVVGAQRRTESRGGHYRSDFPAEDPAQARSATLTISDIEAF